MSLEYRPDIEYRSDLKMSDCTTFKIGGEARHVFLPKNSEEVAELVRYFAAEGLGYFVLGNGSNVLMSDDFIELPIIKIGSAIAECRLDGDSIVVGAGLPLCDLVRTALDSSLTGAEFAHCIPGTVGGAVFMNAGAFGGEMKDIVKWLEIVDSSGDIYKIIPDSSFFGHRFSLAQEKKWIITRVCVQLEKGDPAKISARMDEIAAKRREKQPLEYPSAGSVFKRPAGNYASKLIDEAGLKGKRIGGAKVSEKHAGFIVNTGGATAADVKELMNCIVDVVYKKSGIVLEPEIVVFKDTI